MTWGSPLLVTDEYVDDAGSMVVACDPSAGGMGEADPAGLALPAPRLPAELPEDLGELGDPGGTDRMAPGQQPAAGVDRDPPGQRRVAALEQPRPLPRPAQAEGFGVHQFGDRERVVQLDHVEFTGAQAGLL